MFDISPALYDVLILREAIVCKRSEIQHWRHLKLSWSKEFKKIWRNKVYAWSRRTKSGLELIRTCTRSGTYVHRGTLLQRERLIAEARSLVLYNLLEHVRRGRSARLNRSQRFLSSPRRWRGYTMLFLGPVGSREERRNSRCEFPKSPSPFLSFYSCPFLSFSLPSLFSCSLTL